jgi:hypothetical protein
MLTALRRHSGPDTSGTSVRSGPRETSAETSLLTRAPSPGAGSVLITASDRNLLGEVTTAHDQCQLGEAASRSVAVSTGIRLRRPASRSRCPGPADEIPTGERRRCRRQSRRRRTAHKPVRCAEVAHRRELANASAGTTTVSLSEYRESPLGEWARLRQSVTSELASIAKIFCIGKTRLSGSRRVARTTSSSTPLPGPTD